MKFHDEFISIISTKTKQKLVRFLLQHDAPMSEREIAAAIGISHMSVNRILRELEAWTFVHYDRIGQSHVWKVDRQSYIYGVLVSIIQVIDSLPDPLQALQQDILRMLPLKLVRRIIIFGSLAKAAERADSDIDLFICVKDHIDLDPLEAAIDKLSVHCLQKFGNRLSPYVLSEKEYQQKKHSKLLKEIVQGLQLFPEQKEL